MFKNLQQDENEIFYIGVKALIKNPSGQILLVHDTPRLKVDGQSETYWDIPGGRVQLDERSLIETLKREVKEELNINDLKVGALFDCTISNHLSQFDEKKRISLCLVAYMCTIPTDAVITLSDEHDQYKWLTPQEASELLKIKYPEDFTSKVASLDE